MRCSSAAMSSRMRRSRSVTCGALSQSSAATGAACTRWRPCGAQKRRGCSQQYSTTAAASLSFRSDRLVPTWPFQTRGAPRLAFLALRHVFLTLWMLCKRPERVPAAMCYQSQIATSMLSVWVVFIWSPCAATLCSAAQLRRLLRAPDQTEQCACGRCR
jgi:hypothetical protein